MVKQKIQSMKNLIYVLLILPILVGCRSAKQVVYMQDAKSEIEALTLAPEIKIKKDDLLAIFVSHKNPTLASVYNLQATENMTIGGSATSSMSSRIGGVRQMGYLVDADGNIEFPVLGKLHVEGLTRIELSEMIRKKLDDGDQLKNAIVSVQIQNGHVSVMGEVNNPRRINFDTERMTLLEAIATAGDMTIYGRRDSVMVVREGANGREIMFVNLLSKDFLNSPAYYLQQNDLVYVKPNKIKAQQSGINQNNNVGVWLSVASFLLSIGILIWR